MLAELLSNNIFCDIKWKVGNEESLAWSTKRIAEAFLSVLTRCSCVLGFRKVNVDSTAIDLNILHFSMSFHSVGRIGEFNIAKSAGTSMYCWLVSRGTKLNDLPSGLPTLTVGHDLDASQLSKFLEFAREPLFIDVVGKMTNE